MAEAYLAGLERLAARGKPPKKAASVASFFLSRIDTLLDPILEKKMGEGGKSNALLNRFHGQVALLSAKAAHEISRQLFAGERFTRLRDNGARTQRLLWASTSTKNPDYHDLKYVEALIGDDTINTLPLETLTAYRDHGDPAPRLADDARNAWETLQRLPEVGIDLDAATRQLEDEGIQKFAKAFDGLRGAIEEKRLAALRAAPSGASTRRG